MRVHLVNKSILLIFLEAAKQWRDLLYNYTQATTMHGIRYVTQGPGKYLRRSAFYENNPTSIHNTSVTLKASSIYLNCFPDCHQ